MRLAILGATSNIAKDLIRSFAGRFELRLFSRRPQEVSVWLTDMAGGHTCRAFSYDEFAHHEHDAVLNFVGVGDPARAASMGADIFDVTLQFDQLVLDYIKTRPACRYIFMSSGAAYGNIFSAPAQAGATARLSINELKPADWYGVAKLHAECRHRAWADRRIVDVRIFNYFSRHLDCEGRFLIADIIRAIKQGTCLQTQPGNIVRDYIGAEDFASLIASLLERCEANDVVDCYSRAAVEQAELAGCHAGRVRIEVRIRRDGERRQCDRRQNFLFFRKPARSRVWVCAQADFVADADGGNRSPSRQGRMIFRKPDCAADVLRSGMSLERCAPCW
ncbi:MAG: NAD-dependent epimerase/dehydratase family protein [Rhodocyclaceae bacterium]